MEMMVIRHYDCTKCHSIVQFQMVNCVPGGFDFTSIKEKWAKNKQTKNERALLCIQIYCLVGKTDKEIRDPVLVDCHPIRSQRGWWVTHWSSAGGWVKTCGMKGSGSHFKFSYPKARNRCKQ